jgi:hypothetical protein
MTRTYYPPPQENVATGVIGILIFMFIASLCVTSILQGFKSLSTRQFFITMLVMSLFELPRYFDLAVDASYTSIACYCFHIVAGPFFFLGYSIVCWQWSGLLELGSYFKAVYGYNGLLVVNVAFVIIDFTGLIICATCPSLATYFASTAFVVLTFLEACRNLIYSSFLSFYGLKLVRRFSQFSKRELQTQLTLTSSDDQPQSGCCKCACPCQPMKEDQVFTRVVTRLTSVLLLVTFCFFLRFIMLIAKMAELHTEKEYTNHVFTLFGLLWFTLADFIPRAVPALAFIFLMRQKRPSQKANPVAESSEATRSISMSNAFEFGRMQTSDEETGNDGGGSLIILDDNGDEELESHGTATANVLHELAAADKASQSHSSAYMYDSDEEGGEGEMFS